MGGTDPHGPVMIGSSLTIGYHVAMAGLTAGSVSQQAVQLNPTADHSPVGRHD